jgi:MraZ protein
VSRFFGRFQHTLDVKGRVVLPARFRKDFDTLGYLTQHTEGCVALWTPEEFDKKLSEMEVRQDRGAADRNLARIWAASSTEVEIDRQGRVAVPQYLREFGRLGTSVYVMGAMERVELWNPQVWDEKIKPSEEALINPPDPVPAAATAG